MPYIIAIIVLVVVGVGFTLFRAEPSNTTAATPENTSTTSAPIANTEDESDDGRRNRGRGSDDSEDDDTPAPATTAGAYADGTYDTTVTYLTPVRSEYKLDVELTLKDGIVTAADVAYSQGAEKDPNAQRFEGAYEAVVIGKSLDSLTLSRVGGASLTTGAFNEALANIKTDAKS